MNAFYNEHDPQKAAWLRELIKQNVIAPGEVDERSITELQPADLRGFRQCHFFAGIGVWSYALRLAGWPDDRPVWTGSCPCPSFSAAGKGKGFADPRHLWPAWYRLIPESNPPAIFGEQVASAIGYGWLDLVQTDLERANYAVGKAVLGACSVGAPHIRQRLYFGAHAQHAERRAEQQEHGNAHGRDGLGWSSNLERGANLQSVGRGMEHATHERTSDREGNAFANDSKPRLSPHADGRFPSHGDLQRSGEQRLLAEDSGTGECADTGVAESGRLSGSERQAISSPRSASETLFGCDSPQRGQPMRGSAPGNGGHATQPNESLFGSQPLSPRLERHFGDVRDWRGPGWLDPLTARSVAEAGATRGFWADCDWWHARDEKYRPIGPGIAPLVSGATKRSLQQMVAGIADDLRPLCDSSTPELESTEARVLRLRGYGDAICGPLAAEFIGANMEILDAR